MSEEENVQTNVAEDTSAAAEELRRLNAAFEESDFTVQSVAQLKRSVYIRRELYDRVREIAVEVAEKNLQPSGAEKASVALGVAQWMLGHYAEAVDSFRAARKTPFVEYMLGLCLKERGCFQEAEKVLSHAHEKRPDDAELGLLLVRVQAMLGDAAAATRTLKAFKSLDSVDAEYTRGFVAELSGDYEEAREHYENALAADPESVECLFRLALNYDLGGDDETAMEYYRRCLKIQPGYTGAVVNLGLLLEDHGRHDEAARFYQRVLIDEPNNPRAKLYLRDAEATKVMYYDEEKERKADKRNRVLETPVTDFELSVRSRNCLDLMGIRTLGDLINVTESELLSYKNFGETSLAEIKNLLASKGLRLGQGLEEPPPPAEKVEDKKPKSESEHLGKPVSDLE